MKALFNQIIKRLPHKSNWTETAADGRKVEVETGRLLGATFGHVVCYNADGTPAGGKSWFNSRRDVRPEIKQKAKAFLSS